ncbi:N-acetylmuramoyl-L-alanine amidase CwlD [Anaerophilus nitritogenes]|uniref:N-acetylmuramoyl-L-alanine amidase CwlD n=1 Tax=Anaerophilus nitritogenes TaxID=2498136 RepID=UPI001FAAA8DA|nr:N-acetylmuramoyl-L-alanine amidase CwlD [Anaerophilus nitritogenes]
MVMKKKWIFRLFVLCFVIYIFSFSTRILEVSNRIMLNKVIIIDAGHGGIDGGTVSKSGVCESHINLSIALKVRKLLEQDGAVVLLTRNKDIGLYTEEGSIRKKKNEDLRNRKKIRDESNADLFISIHMNSFTDSKYYGAQTFYPKNSEESKKVSEYIQEELIKVLDDGNHRKPKEKSDVYLLKESSIPMVLIECGFLSNPQEEKLLQDAKYQEKVAWSIYTGMMKYFQEEKM